jgi:magnesium chelatase family protein
VEVTQIHGLAEGYVAELVRDRPFRAPHHSITAAGLIGGAHRAWLGEAVLAHNGVLFLDELSEFARPTLEALRQPLEDGRVAIARARHAGIYPSRFMLIAATNPCPCGYWGMERCRCSESELMRYRRRLSGPLLDRIDLLVNLSPPCVDGAGSLALTSSAQARTLVLEARERQAARVGEGSPVPNARIDARTLREHARLSTKGDEMMRRARERGLLSERGQARVLRVARTIADLGDSDRVRASDIGGALAMHPEAALMDVRAA